MNRMATMYASEIKAQLHELLSEQALVLATDAPPDLAYVADLEDEIAATRDAYVGTAVTEIASLRAALSGPLHG